MCVLKSVLKKFGYILRSLAGYEDIMKHYREAMIKASTVTELPYHKLSLNDSK